MSPRHLALPKLTRDIECGKKRRYRSKKKAQRSIDELKARFPDNPLHAFLHSYLCRWCDFFHIGHVLPEHADRFASIDAHAQDAKVAHAEALKAKWAQRRAAVGGYA